MESLLSRRETSLSREGGPSFLFSPGSTRGVVDFSPRIGSSPSGKFFPECPLVADPERRVFIFFPTEGL